MIYQYEIHFNGCTKTNASKSRKSYQYDYAGTKDIKLYFCEKYVQATFQMQTKKDLSDFTECKSNLFVDLYMKVHFIYAILFGKGLCVKTLTFIIDGVRYDLDETSGDPHFPYVFSMLKDRQISVPDEWGKIIPAFLTLTKSKIESDERFSVLYSYLSAQVRDYEVDRFLSLWTAINGIGTVLGKEIESTVNLGKKQIVGIDRNVIGILGCWYGNFTLPKVKQSPETDKWRDFFVQDDILNEWSKADKRDLFWQELENFDQNRESKIDNELLKSVCDRFQTSARAFFLFNLPYQLRCNYIHASKVMPVFRPFNDSILINLRVLNPLLEEFIRKYALCMFEGFSDELKEKSKAYVKEKA